MLVALQVLGLVLSALAVVLWAVVLVRQRRAAVAVSLCVADAALEEPLDEVTG